MFINKNTYGYHEAIAASRKVIEEQRARDKAARDNTWRPRKIIGIWATENPASVHPTPAMREKSIGLAGDGYEHSVLTHDNKPQGYWIINCAHERVRWMSCAMCKRDEREAARNWKLFQLGQLK